MGVARDLLGEARAALAQDAAVAVEQDLGRDLDRLGKGALDVDEPSLGSPVAHCLVLQGAFAALVADRAVERVVDQQEFHLTLLGLIRQGRGVLGRNDHAGRGLEGARGLRLGHRAHVAVAVGCGHVDEALAARADRLEERVVAEARDLDPDLLGRADDERSLRNRGLDAVDHERDEVRRGLGSLLAGLLGCCDAHV